MPSRPSWLGTPVSTASGPTGWSIVTARAPARSWQLGHEQDLLRPLADDASELEAEVAWAVEQELALGLDDVLSRRMRLSMSRRDRGASIAPRVAEIVGARLGWDAERQSSEVAHYLETARREYDVPGA